MSPPTELIEKIKRLPERQQLLIGSLVDELAQMASPQEGTQGGDWYGVLEHLGVSITEEDLVEARREMWGGFPREIDQ